MPTMIHHFAVTVSDMDRSVEFYTRYFDLQEILRTDLTGEKISAAMAIPETDLEAVLLAGDNVIFELIQFRRPRGSEHAGNHADVGAAHPCFVVEDLDELHARMSADGVHFNAPPQVLGWDTKMAYCLDPDGLVIEVLQPGPELELSHLLGQEA
jgi:catechol 2,3-dioxygenase-like lactoylglutathione lyase family enzyme